MQQSDSLATELTISPDVRAAFDETVGLRRDLHRHPELGRREHRTRRVVLEHLAASRVEASPVGSTGVCGIVRGKRPGRVLLLRADMDALPIQEEGGASYRSEVPGVMHACGHDAHTAMLLTTARILARRGIAQGAVKLLFQPAEEEGHGSIEMIDAGVLEGPPVDTALAFHVWSPFAVGTVAALDGPVMASADAFQIRISGRGVHAAMPERGIDPILAAAHVVTVLQSLVSRTVSAHERAVVSVAAIHGGDSYNVIPAEVTLQGTIRAFAPAVRRALKAGLVRLAEGVTAAMGASATVEFVEEDTAVVNDPAVAALARRVAAGVVGDAGVITPDPLMPAEDFGFLLERVPGAMVLLGCGAADGSSHPHHHPCFDVDERVLPIGVEIALRLVDAYLEG